MADNFDPNDQEHQDWRSRITHLVNLHFGWREIDLTDPIDVTEKKAEAS